MIVDFVGASLGTAIFNLDSSRYRRWQTKADESAPDVGKKTMFDEGGKNASAGVPILTQHRVAYREQLLLRIFQIPHEVRNSPYLCSESTGPLPFLIDPRTTSLVGRRHPQPVTISGEDDDQIDDNNPDDGYDDDIITYLKSVRGLDPDRSLTSPSQKSQSYLCRSLLINRLEPVRLALLCGQNHPAPFKIDLTLRPLSAFQRWTYRASQRRRYGRVRNERERKRLVAVAGEAYDALDNMLQASEFQDGGNGDENASIHPYLLGTKDPTLVDVLLYDHLCGALQDPYLLEQLSTRSNLLRFVQKIYQNYFGPEYKCEENNVGGDWNWVEYNNNINGENAFHRQWMASSPHTIHYESTHPLILDLAAEIAKQRPLLSKTSGTGIRDHRDEIGFQHRSHEQDKDDGNTQGSQWMKTQKKLSEHNDRIWFGSVALTGLLVMTLSSTLTG